MLLGTLGTNLLSGKGIVRAGYGHPSKKGKGIVRAGSSSASQKTMEFLILPHPLTNFEI